MKRNMTMRVAACAVAFMAISAFGTELTHRWSFNGDCSDSAGGADGHDQSVSPSAISIRE